MMLTFFPHRYDSKTWLCEKEECKPRRNYQAGDKGFPSFHFQRALF